MATEALELPRSTTIRIGIPRRVKVYVRALRIARISRARDRLIVEHELWGSEPMLRLRRPEGIGWLEDLAQTQMQAKMTSR